MPDKPAHLGSSRRSQSPVNTLKKSMTPLKSPGMLGIGGIATANCNLLICCPISRQFINRIKAELKFGKSINSFVSVKTQANWKVCCFVEWGAQRFQTPQCVLLLKVVKEVNSCLLVYWKIAGIPDKTQFYAIFMEVFSPLTQSFFWRPCLLLLIWHFKRFLTYWRPFLPENWAVNWRIPWIISRRHLWLTRYFQDDFYYNFWLCLNSILNPWWITLFKAFHDQLIRKICDSTDFLNSFLNQTSQNQIGDTISIFGSVRGSSQLGL